MSNISEQRRGIIEMVLAMFLMGTVGYFVVETRISAHDLVFFRCLFGIIFLSLYCFAYGLFKNTQLTKKILFIIALSGFFLIINWILLFESFKLSSISTSTVVYHVQPFFFVIIGAIILRESIPKNKMLWMFLAFIGLIFVVDIDIKSFSFTSDYIIGISLALVAAIFWAISAILVKYVKGIKPHLIVLIQLIVGIFILFPFTNIKMMSYATNAQWGYLIILGGVHTCLTYILMYSAYQKLSTTVIAVLTFIYPAVAIIVDFVCYGKSLNAFQLLGVFLIMFSSFAVNQNIPFTLKKK
ncbi:DMT family transporter [Xenorhabdus sp. XENO-1]|uniref:DMT family transporter n=1 Tax=Xenorhabdus bovienii TaxID=40576 RepID=UPI0020CA3345|nr:DMT family transporter [Xenorhabdus bovienii]MCP9269644.1 DMT family transporter [Xenorhabdus bovienii subsp. africana]